jgi:hypothetical protein
MSYATTKFVFPFEPIEPIYFPVECFEYKETYDKYYILDGLEFLPRYEVALTAIKHGMLNASGESTTMHRNSKFINHKKEAWVTSASNREMPEYFGMWTGKFIPVLKNFHPGNHILPPNNTIEQKNKLGEYWTPEYLNKLTLLWCEEFFEYHAEFWLEMLMGKGHSTELDEYSSVGRTVWVRFYTGTTWIPTYQALVAEGLPPSPSMEAEIQSISQFITVDEPHMVDLGLMENTK